MSGTATYHLTASDEDTAAPDLLGELDDLAEGASTGVDALVWLVEGEPEPLPPWDSEEDVLGDPNVIEGLKEESAKLDEWRSSL